jgi:hypothetical protein
MQAFIMFAMSLLLIAYGVVALFKKDWIWRVREFSARIEGKENLKRDEYQSINQLGNGMAVISLIAGVTLFAMNIAMMVLVTT